jgi:hypothetical protein
MIQKNITAKVIQYFDGTNSLVASNIAKIQELFHCENARSPQIGTIEKREGMGIVGLAAGSLPFKATDNAGLFYFSNSSNKGLYRVSTVGGVQAIYYLNNSGVWTALLGLGTNLTITSGDLVSTCMAESDCYLVNQGMTPRYIVGTNGATVVDSSTATGNLFNCPKANIINYYKGRLYVADYQVTDGSGFTTYYPNTLLMSSTQLGIISLVNNDVAVGIKVIPVTDIKYFQVGETVEFRRGNSASPLTTGTIASIQETTITLTANIGVALQASDEIWVKDTFLGKKVFRWVYNPSAMGTNVKNYDTFKMSSTTDNDSERINVVTNVGNMMLIATSNNLAIWNNYVLQNLDFGVGCCSKKGHVKSGGLLYFLHYTGIYSTEGNTPTYISSKVERYIRGATKANMDVATAGKKGRNVFFCIGDVTLRRPDGSIEKVLKDVCLEYSITQQNWYVHTNWKIKRAVTYISSDDPDRLVGISTFTDLPVVELLLAGSYLDASSASAVNTEIPFRMDTPNILLGTSFQLISYPVETHIEMERGIGMKCFVSLDMDDYYELHGEAGKGLTIFKVHGKTSDVAKPARCRNIRLSLRHSGRQLCKVSKIAIFSLMMPEEQQIKPDGE